MRGVFGPRKARKLWARGEVLLGWAIAGWAGKRGRPYVVHLRVWGKWKRRDAKLQWAEGSDGMADKLGRGTVLRGGEVWIRQGAEGTKGGGRLG